MLWWSGDGSWGRLTVPVCAFEGLEEGEAENILKRKKTEGGEFESGEVIRRRNAGLVRLAEL